MRFPEFSGEWEKCTLRDISEISKGSGISKDQLSAEREPCILYGELYTKYKSEVINDVYSRTNIDTTNLVRSKKNDIIIPASGETAIDISTARCVPFDGILLGGDLSIIRLKEQDGRYFSYQLNGIRKLDIAKIAQGVSVVHLYGENLKRLKVAYPAIKEQSKIADFINLIDRRIATQNKIIEELKSLIFVVNKRLLYGNNSTEYVRLGEIATITNGTNDVQDASLEYTVGLYPFYDRSEIIKYLNTYFLDKEAIIYPGEGSEFLPRYHNGKFALHQRCYAIYDIKNEYMVKYLYYYMQNLNNYFIRNAVGSTVPSLRLDTFKRIKIPVLPICEQRKICNVLDTLSNKLQIEQECLSKYQLQKQYLLQRMFI